MKIKRGEERSGQVMLTGAFLLAITIVIVTFMLNNLIYTGNIAYLGFMDQSSYDDLSLKDITIDGMTTAYANSGGDSDVYNQYMSDYSDAVNTILLQNGKYVTLSGDTNHQTGTFTISEADECERQFSINDKSSSKTYNIITKYETPPATSTLPDSYPTDVIITIGSSAGTILPSGTTTITVDVQNSNGYLGEPGAWFYITSSSGGTFDGTGLTTWGVQTDAYGKAYVQYKPAQAGVDTIYAYVLTDYLNPLSPHAADSNTIKISTVNIVNTQCTHVVDVGPAIVSHTKEIGNGNKPDLDFIEVKIPVEVPLSPLMSYDFSSQGNDQKFEATIAYPSLTNLEMLSTNSQYISEISNSNVESTTVDWDGHYIWIKMHWKAPSQAYTAVLIVNVKAHCKTEGANGATLDRTYTFQINGGPSPGTTYPFNVPHN